jgi:hypothetical protein
MSASSFSINPPANSSYLGSIGKITKRAELPHYCTSEL